MFKNIKPLFSLLVSFLVITFTFTACDTTSHDHEDDHIDAVGFVLVQNNAEILRYENNVYNWNTSGTWDDYFRDGVDGLVLSTDVIDLTQDNPRGMTPSITLRWLDDHGDHFDLPDLSEDEGGEYWLNWEWEKPNTLTEECTDEAREDVAVLDQIRPANLEQHGGDGQWGFHFRADHAGQDRIRFRLMHGHGTAAHPDFTSQWMNVTVPDDDHDLIDVNGIYLHERNKCRVDRPLN